MPAATMSIEEDRLLVGRFQAGEASIFDELYAKHVDRVYSIAYRLVGDSEIAADISQETFIRVYKNLNRFRFEAKLSTWIYSIVLNLARNHYRKRKWKMMDEIPEDLPQTDAPDIVNGVSRNIDKENIRKLVALLPQREREALVLRHYEGLSCAEAARIMSCAPETIRSLTFFAIRKLREILREEGYEV